MTEQVDIISHLITVSPALGVLVWMVYYFRGQIKEKDEQIRDLNESLRDSEKETIGYLKDIANSIERFNEKR